MTVLPRGATDDEILAWLLDDLELPPEAGPTVRKSGLYQRAVLAHRLRDVQYAIVDESPRWLHRLVRRVLRMPA